MSNITRLLSNVMDIPEQYGDVLYNEARSKLVGTYVIINGQLVYLSHISINSIEGSTDSSEYSISRYDIQTLDVYLPLSGMYKMGNARYEYLQKLAKRQWKKSFAWTYYHLSNRLNDNEVFKLFGKDPVSMYKTEKGDIYYRRLKIADKSKILVPSFHYEIEAFNRANKHVT